VSRLKVLAVAYACNPDRGSEFGVGWGWVNAIARNHDVTVITADFNAADIERYLREKPLRVSHHLRFIYVKNRAWHYRPHGLWLTIENSVAKPLMNLAYHDWLRCAYRAARRETEQHAYDLVHLITYVGWRFPGKFYQLDVPFVWGPIGGLMNTPYRLFPALGVKGAVYYAGRNLINTFQIHLLRGPRRALRQAHGAIVAATSEIQAALLRHFGSSSRVICEIGLPEINPGKPKLRASGEPLEICWSGLHLPGKALPLLLHAVARLPSGLSYRLQILGDGPSSPSWRKLAKRLGVDEHCHWHGQLPRKQALEIMKECHVFVITSLKDLTSTVAVEAAALGLPIVCLDHCGFADLVTGRCGIKVRTGSIQEIVAGLSQALSTLYNHEDLRCELAHGALARGREYSWQSKMVALEDVYRDAIRNGRSAEYWKECETISL
jgi:glycosyltransferase involved in cell wall biosynthesis